MVLPVAPRINALLAIDAVKSGAIVVSLYTIQKCNVARRFPGAQDFRGYQSFGQRSRYWVMVPELSRFLVIAIILVTGVAGCGSKVPFDMVPVHGKLTYEDGTLVPAESILVTFNPIRTEAGSKTAPPGGTTSVNVQDGTFGAVTSHRKDDGLVIGKHKVVVVSFKKGANGNPTPTSAVPPVYRQESTTPLEVEVQSSDQFLELKVRKQ